jgi:hypothetical protein
VEGKTRDPVRVTEYGVAKRAAAGQLGDQLVTIFSAHDRLRGSLPFDHLVHDDATEEGVSAGRQFPRAGSVDRCRLAEAPSPHRNQASGPGRYGTGSGIAQRRVTALRSLHHAGFRGGAVMTGPGDERAAAQGQGQGRGHGGFRASHTDREQVIDVLKAAFVQGRLTKDELDMRVGQVLASRTYADLAAVTADLPARVAAAPPTVPARGTSRTRSYRRRQAVGWVACVVIPLVLLLSRGFGPAFILGFFGAMLTAGCMIAAASERKHSRGPLPQGPSSGAGGQASRRAAPLARPQQLPPADHGQQHTAEATRSSLAHPRSPASRSAHQLRPLGHRYTIGYAGY